MPKWTEKEDKDAKKAALAAISKLKRSIGIPNHKVSNDEFIHSRVHIYTTDEESADLISELLHRYGGGKRSAHYDTKPEIHTLRDTLQIRELDEGGFNVSMLILHPSHFADQLQKMTDKYIAPDSRFLR